MITFDADLQLVCAPSIQEHYASETIAANFKVYEGKPLTLPAEAAGPKPEFLAWHLEQVFGK